MSIKKTWFSYILWLFATGFSILFTYSYITGIISCYSFEQVNSVYCRFGFTAVFVLSAGLIYALLGWIRSRMKGISISKWGRRIFHIVVICSITALFAVTRYMVLWSTALEDIVPMEIYEAAKVMLGNGQTASYEIYYVFEEIYINILSGLFLFLGNKMEVMLYFQIFLQTVSFLLLLFIGRTLQNGFFAWIPATVYALSQFCMATVLCLNADNLSFFLVLLVLALICLLEKAWKNKTVTYVLIATAGIIFSALCAIDAFPHVADWNSVFEFWFHEKLLNGGAEVYWSFLILMVFMLFYCISFWKTKTDNVSAYILPVLSFSVIIYLDLWPDILATLFMLIRIYMSFIAAEGLRILFTEKTEAFAEQGAEDDMKVLTETVSDPEPTVEEKNDFSWTEMKELMEQKEENVSEESSVGETSDNSDEDAVSEDTGVIRVSDILKAVNSEEETKISESDLTEKEMVVDKTAMIENVLPMPKKHVARTFEYAFEPAEDMMHYDVEIENDDYDFD